LKNRQTGTVVSSLDLPVDITIKVDPVGVTLQNATVSLDVIKCSNDRAIDDRMIDDR
jgi:hypothetical protein